MMFFRKRRPPYILLFFVLVVVLLMTFQSRMGLTRQPLFGLLSPAFSLINAAYDGVVDLWNDYLALVGTEAENRRLVLEVQKLRQENVRAAVYRRENRRLRSLLEMRDRAARPMLAAEVTSRSPVGSVAALTINRGTADGLRADLPVMAADGLVGRVFAVTPWSAKVLLITDPKSAVSVRFEDSREQAILDGSGSSCSLKYVHKDAEVLEGYIVVTAGLDGIFPPGLPVGTVSRVQKLDYGIFQEADLEPFVAFRRLEEVMVLLPEPEASP